MDNANNGWENKEGFEKKKEWERNKVKDTPSTYFLPGSYHTCACRERERVRV